MIAPEDVFSLRQRYWRHGYRPLAIWNPDQQADDKGAPLNSSGEQLRQRFPGALDGEASS